MSTLSLDDGAQRELQASRGANDGLWEWDPISNEVSLSPRWKELLGFRESEFPNSFDAWRDHVHPEDLPVVLAALRNHRDTPTLCYQVDYRLRHKDGSYRWFFLHGGTVRDSRGTPLRIIGWHIDITERKQAEAQRLRWLALRAEVSQLLTESGSLPDMLQRCCKALEGQLQVACALIWLVGEQEGEMHTSESLVTRPAVLEEQSQDQAFVLALGRIAWQREPYLTNEAPNDPSLGLAGWVERERITAFAGYPLLVEERVVGVMALLSRERFTTETLELLALLANAIAQGIGRKWAEQALEERLRHQTRALELLQEFANTTSSTRTLPALLGGLLEQIKAVVDYTGLVFYRVEDDLLTSLAQQPPQAGASHSEVHQFLIREVLSAAPDQLREPVIVADLPTSHRFGQAYLAVLEQAPEQARQFRSWMIVPLVVQGQVLALLAFNSELAHAFTPQHARFAGALATPAAFFTLDYPRLATHAHTYASFLERLHRTRELHEAIAAHLYTILSCEQQVEEALVSDPAAAAAPLRTALLLTRVALADLHALDVELRPDLLETEGLIVALSRLLEATHLRQNVPVEERLGNEPRLSVASKYALYRIAQQALSQVISHTQARTITLRLEQEEQALVLEVRAESAFTAGAAPGRWHRQSEMQLIWKYAEQLNAHLSIDGDYGGETTLTVRLPLPR